MANKAAGVPTLKQIRSLDLEAELTETARTIESAVATANEYLMRRARLPDGQAELRNTETNGGACESNPAIVLESIKAGASGQRAAAIAEEWLHGASEEAVEMDAEKWERWREKYVEHDTAAAFV